MSSPAKAESPEQGGAQKSASPASQQDPGDNTIEAAGDDEDAGYYTDTASTVSTSVSSSVRDYAFENGRRYHKFREGTYQFPNDEPEQAREDMKHAMLVNVCDGRLHYAPLGNSQQILDLGTGTGIWCMDMGDEYPDSTVLGIDLSPIQPIWVPPNVKFMVDDFESPWLHGDEYFDYVHARNIAPVTKDLPKVLSEAYRSIKPGGWIEFQEQQYHAFCDDDTMPEHHMLNEWWENLRKALAEFGRDLQAVLKMEQLLRDAGFVNIEERVVKIPIGPWAKDKKLKTAGMYCRAMVEDGLEGLSLGPMSRGLGWSPEEIQVYLVGVRKALMDRSVHAYMSYHAIYGQKPLS
ncbi:S-adenosyl-L-methionine-dependent methyltransferase [Hyaloscypha variabilis]